MTARIDHLPVIETERWMKGEKKNVSDEPTRVASSKKNRTTPCLQLDIATKRRNDDKEKKSGYHRRGEGVKGASPYGIENSHVRKEDR